LASPLFDVPNVFLILAFPSAVVRYAFNRTADFQTVQEIKEKYCYCAYVPLTAQWFPRCPFIH
jgi:hypothetical protein